MEIKNQIKEIARKITITKINIWGPSLSQSGEDLVYNLDDDDFNQDQGEERSNQSGIENETNQGEVFG